MNTIVTWTTKEKNMLWSLMKNINNSNLFFCHYNINTMSLTNGSVNNIRNKENAGIDTSNFQVTSITASNYFMSGGLVLQTADILSTKNILTGITYDQAAQGWAVNSNAGRYEGYKLQSFINNSNGELTRLGIDTEQGKIKVVVETSNEGYLMLETRLTVPRNVSLEFKCPVLAGNYGQVLLNGLDAYIPANSLAKPLLASNAAVGESNFTIWRNGTSVSEMANWTAGSLIRSRNEDEENGEDMTIAWCSNIPGTSNYNLVVNEPTTFTLDAGIDGFRRYSASKPTANTTVGQTYMYVTDTTPFTLGDTVGVYDTRVVSEIYGSNTSPHKTTGAYFWWSGNRAHHEIKRITAIDSNNSILHFETPFVYTYNNSNTTYVSLMKPIENTMIKDLTMIQFEPPTYNPPSVGRLNKHKIHLQKCVNCTVENVLLTDCATFLPRDIQYPFVDASIRMDKCFHSIVRNSKLMRVNNTYTSSSVGYGLLLFNSSKIVCDNIKLDGYRHGMMLAGTNASMFTNFDMHDTKGSALDLHGTGEHENTFMNFNIIASPATVALDTTNSNNDANLIELIQVGNSTHTGGACRNKFMNFNLSYGRPTLQPGSTTASNLANVYGIQIIGNSRQNTFQNFTMDNIHKCLYIGDSVRGRLNSNLRVQDTTFTNFNIRNCDKLVELMGNDNTSNQYSYLATATTAYTSNTITFDSNVTTASAVNYNHYYSNWTLQLDGAGSNYRVLDYDATTATVTIDGAFSPAISSNVPFTLHDSNVNTVWQIDGVRINNWTCRSNNYNSNIFNDPMRVHCIRNLSVTNSIFNTCTNPLYKFVFMAHSNEGVTIMDNISSSNNGFLEFYYNSNVTIANNSYNNQIASNSNMIYDLGSNVNVTHYNNNGINFTDWYQASGTTTYNKQSRKLGFSNNPETPAIIINNSNGCLGVGGQLVPYAPLAFKDATNSKKICLYENSSNNPHQFYGFGVDSGSVLRYQCASSTAGGHVFYAATSSNASTERFRIGSNNQIKIGGNTPSNALVCMTNTATTQAFFNFNGSNFGNISSSNTLGPQWGKVKVYIEGVGEKWMPIYDS